MKLPQAILPLAIGCFLALGPAQMAGGYTLTVNSGSGDGTHAESTPVSVVADVAPSGYAFNMWVGDPDGFADWNACKASSSTYTMPARDMTLTATYRPTSSPTDWWPSFNIFCKETFGAEKEPLAYDIFGSSLAFMSEPGSEWSHISETSACIAFETNLPANTYIEYGETTAYGSQTPASDRHYYLHIYHLKDLNPDTTYHYRFVAEDERANVITSSDKTFTTATPADVIYVPAGVSGPPYDLNQSGKTYLLTEDIMCDRTAFSITADNITLDLGGHTVIYDQVPEDPVVTSPNGVTGSSRSNIKVLNGVIKQGLAYDPYRSPVRLWWCSGEVAGLSIEYAGSHIHGMDLRYGGFTAHHNVVLDRGGDIVDRDDQVKAINSRYSTGPSLTHHNLIKRARQCGIDPGSNDHYNNEIYVDSCCTNSFAITLYKNGNCSCYGNRIFGTGYLVVGIATLSTGAADIMVHDNFVHLQAVRPDTRWDEFDAQSGAYCCRIDWDGDNIQYYDNVMVTYGKDGGMVRGVWYVARPAIVDCVYRDNVIKAVLQNLASDIQGCIVHCGRGDPTVPRVVFEGNRVISNFCNVRLGEDWDKAGCKAQFYGNTFVKEGPDRPDYRTIGIGYEDYQCTAHRFYDSLFEGGAGYDEVRFDGSGSRNFFVGWTLTVETEPFADVTIRDVFNSVVWTGQADGSGIAEVLVRQYTEEPGARTYHTPHTVTVAKYGYQRTESVTIDAKKTVHIPIDFGPFHSLTVINGSGGGDYPVGAIVNIDADPATSGQEFYGWIGDTSGIADITAPSTTFTMSAAEAEVTATYGAVRHTLTVSNGAGTGLYPQGQIVAISADPAPDGKAFAVWVGQIAYLADRTKAETTVTMPDGDVAVTAVYTWGYALTVYSGTGDGTYLAGAVIDIQADPAPAGMQFDQWTGDMDYIADINSAVTTFTVPSVDCELTATYSLAPLRGDVDGDDFVGFDDLDILLTEWGRSGAEIIDSRADLTGDGFVGQADLDIILDNWCNSR